MTERRSLLADLFTEVKRRKVFRVVAVYAVAAWVAVEVSATIFPMMGLPGWTPKLVLGLAIAGFPIALVLGWAFDVTPDGVKRAPPAAAGADVGDGTPAESPATADAAAGADSAAGTASAARARTRAAGWLGAGILVALVAFGVTSFWMDRPDADEVAGRDADLARTVAVLPFDNLSPDPDDAYFTDGVHGDVLTQLSKIGALDVISRTSVLPYRDTEKSLREIARELQAGMVLEGSVRRAGDQVRITAQLIDARDDTHVWAETYDRALTAENVFRIQSAIAREIAAALEAELTPQERERLAARPTGSVTAYDYYLRGRDYYDNYRDEGNEQAIRLFRRALEVDSAYAPAYAALADAFGQKAGRYGYGAAWTDSAVAAARRALEIDPELPEAYKALGLARLYQDRVHEAIEANRRAIELSPNHEPAMGNLGVQLALVGRLDEALRWTRRAVELSPRSAVTRDLLAVTYLMVGDYAEAERQVRRALELQPDYVVARARLAQVLAYAGRTEEAVAPARAASAAAPRTAAVQQLAGMALLFAGRIEDALRAYERAMAVERVWFVDFPIRMPYALRERGDTTRAAEIAARLREEIRTRLDAGADASFLHHGLAVLAAFDRGRDAALRHLENAVDAGFADVRVMRIDPALEPLRDDPRFRALMAGVEERVAEMRGRAARSGE